MSKYYWISHVSGYNLYHKSLILVSVALIPQPHARPNFEHKYTVLQCTVLASQSEHKEHSSLTLFSRL